MWIDKACIFASLFWKFFIPIAFFRIVNEIDFHFLRFSSGQEIQCISVVRNLPHLIKSWQNECIRRVVPKLKELLHTAGIARLRANLTNSKLERQNIRFSTSWICHRCNNSWIHDERSLLRF